MCSNVKTDRLKETDNINRVCALANAVFYDHDLTKEYNSIAPHVKHLSIRKLYVKLAIQVYDFAKKQSVIPRVLDLGAGEGAATLLFLELGAHVTAVDVSNSQLVLLKNKCQSYKNRLDVYLGNIEEFLKSSNNNSFDIVVVSSFLHHVPDYSGLITKIIALLSSRGQFFSFQDPLRYNTVGIFTKLFSNFAYFSWRIFQGDVVGGILRKIRRTRGIYFDYVESDNIEYHVVRNGVDQNVIIELFKNRNFHCQIIPYFSTQSLMFQFMGDFLGLKNTFSVIARS